MKSPFIKLIVGVAALLTAVSCEKDENPSVLDPDGPKPVEKPERWFVAAEQSKQRIIVVNTRTDEIEWEWDASKSGIPAEHRKWFELPDEVKPIYNGNYFLVVGTRGGVGIVRKADHKMMFYAQPKGSPHSAELLPDGNIVVACSTDGTADGDKLKLYKVDTANSPASAPAAVYSLPFGHNAVWDRGNEVLWATADNVLNSYTYAYSNGRPALELKETIPLPVGQSSAHDLFPVYGENKLWLSTGSAVYKFDVSSKSFEKFPGRTNTSNIKSVSSGPGDYPVMMLRPTESWWSPTVIDSNGNAIYVGPATFRIYKARWLLDNTFSYPEQHEFTQPGA